MLISIGEFLFLGRELPSVRSWICLVTLVAGAAVYVRTDAAFNVSGYQWVLIWYFIFVFDQIYIKHVISTVQMKSNWGRVYYNNLLAIPPLLIFGGIGSEIEALSTHVSIVGAVLTFASCVAGVGMSYFSFLARNLLSATHFTVVGNLCKIATVILNCLLWDKHATPAGIAALLTCLAAGYAYTPAPMRNGDDHLVQGEYTRAVGQNVRAKAEPVTDSRVKLQ